jgi:hypothetical protein
MAKFGKNVYGMMGYFQKVAAGHYQLKWWGDVVDVKREFVGIKPTKWWQITVNGEFKQMKLGFGNAVNWVANVWGKEPVMTHNILNPAAGEFPISRDQKGGCCDPATERYHSM